MKSSDIFIYNGYLDRSCDLRIIETVHKNKNSDSCVLILVTHGGDPDAAYKIGRYFQRRYEDLAIMISGPCKSAGTLLAISAKELVFLPYGELGPLDVQTAKLDDLSGFESGLNISEAFSAIEGRAKDTYHSLIAELIGFSGGRISIHTATHAAAEMVSALYSPVFGHIDPEDVGSRSRAMRIGEVYANRLNQKWGNLKQNAIKILTTSYPSHNFVIDADEAEALFDNVRMANEKEEELINGLENKARTQLYVKDPLFECLSNSKDKK